MNKIRIISLLLALSLLMTSCGSQQSSGSHSQSGSSSVEDVINEKITESQNDVSQDPQVPDTSGTTSEAVDPPSEKTEAGTYSNVEIDLTSMNANMVYSQVYDMITQPDGYLGKTVKISGQFAISEGQDRIYCACIVADATACCSQGIEFILEGEPPYPEGYPALGTEITVAGVFDTYVETVAGQDFTFIQLINAELMT